MGEALLPSLTTEFRPQDPYKCPAHVCRDIYSPNPYTVITSNKISSKTK